MILNDVRGWAKGTLPTYNDRKDFFEEIVNGDPDPISATSSSSASGLRLPVPDPNERIGRHRPDMLWRKARLIVELDGEDAHTTTAQIASDRTRQRVLENLGYTVLRFTWAEVRFEPARVNSEVGAALAALTS